MQKQIISETKHFLFCPIIVIATKVMPSVVSQGLAWQFSKIRGYVILAQLYLSNSLLTSLEINQITDH